MARKIRNSRGGATATVGIAAAAVLFGVVNVEGGYVDHPSDPGGETNHGITVAVARANGYTGRMRDLTREQALEIYSSQYIERPRFDAILDRCETQDVTVTYVDGEEQPITISSVNPSLGWELIDTGVNAGTGRAAKWFQESLNHFNLRGRLYPNIAEDGRIGPGTLAAFDRLSRRRGRAETCEVLRRAVDAKQAQHYMRLFGNDRKFEDFAWGWFRTRVGVKTNPN